MRCVPRGAWAHLSAGVCLRRSIASGQAAERRYGLQREWHSRYLAHVACQPHHGDQRMKKRHLTCTRCILVCCSTQARASRGGDRACGCLGAMCAATPRRAGYGMPWITTQARCEPRSLADGRIRASSNCKRCWSHDRCAAWGAPIARVEVQIDGGLWMAAPIDRSEEAAFAWKLWSLEWANATPGEHTITSCAVDTQGNVQPAMEAPRIRCFYLGRRLLGWPTP